MAGCKDSSAPLLPFQLMVRVLISLGLSSHLASLCENSRHNLVELGNQLEHGVVWKVLEGKLPLQAQLRLSGQPRALVQVQGILSSLSIPCHLHNDRSLPCHPGNSCTASAFFSLGGAKYLHLPSFDLGTLRLLNVCATTVP